MSSSQYATFEVDDQLFGVPVAIVQEVLSFSEYTPVPLAPKAVGGLFNLRGQVIAAVDLRVQDESVSLLVDRIGEVVDLHEDAFEPPPDTLYGPTRELINGAFKLDGRLMLALDTARAADTGPGPTTQE